MKQASASWEIFLSLSTLTRTHRLCLVWCSTDVTSSAASISCGVMRQAWRCCGVLLAQFSVCVVRVCNERNTQLQVGTRTSQPCDGSCAVPPIGGCARVKEQLSRCGRYARSSLSSCILPPPSLNCQNFFQSLLARVKRSRSCGLHFV